MGLPQAPNQPTGQVTPNPSSVVHKFLVDVCSQSQLFRAMPSMLMSTMNFSFAQPAQAGKKCQPQAWDTLVNTRRPRISSGVTPLTLMTDWLHDLPRCDVANQFAKFSHMTHT